MILAGHLHQEHQTFRAQVKQASPWVRTWGLKLSSWVRMLVRMYSGATGMDSSVWDLLDALRLFGHVVIMWFHAFQVAYLEHVRLLCLRKTARSSIAIA